MSFTRAMTVTALVTVVAAVGCVTAAYMHKDIDWRSTTKGAVLIATRFHESLMKGEEYRNAPIGNRVKWCWQFLEEPLSKYSSHLDKHLQERLKRYIESILPQICSKD